MKVSPKTPSESNAMAAARELGAQGFRVFQIKPEGNTPLKKGWQDLATTAPKSWPLNANIGIATGDGLLVVDVDIKNDGDGSLLELPDLPRTLVSDTPGGGCHYFYRYDPTLDVRNSTSKVAPGIDIRATGGYVVAPPSPRKGSAYVWRNNAPIADAPEWLLDRIARTAAATTKPSVSCAPIEAKQLRELLKDRDPACSYEAWNEVIAVIHHESSGEDWGLELAAEWSEPEWQADRSKYASCYEEIEAKWSSYGNHPNPKTAASLRVEKAASVDDFDVIKPAAEELAIPTGLARQMRRQKDGRFLPELSNVLTTMREEACPIEVRHDQFRDELMLAPRGSDQWRACRDTDVTSIQEAFERAGFKPISREVMRNALHKIGEENSFDSAIHWLNGLQWDGAERVGNFLADYFNAEDSAYTRAVSAYWWTAQAARVLEPGCQVDMIPVLVGGQGQRKSSALAAAVPAPEHFTGFGFDKMNHSDTSRRMRGVLLGEIAELKGINSRDIESIKDWITRRHERWTPKYQEFDAVFPRRLVFVGTTNNAEFLADKTGNRRWLPVAVGQVDSDAIERDRAQLWAEGRDLFRGSGIAWQAAEDLAPTVHEDYVISDSWEDAIAEWLAQPADFDDVTRDGEAPPRSEQPFTVADVLRGALGFQAGTISKAPEMRAAEILRAMRFVRKKQRVNGEPKWMWTR